MSRRTIADDDDDMKDNIKKIKSVISDEIEEVQEEPEDYDEISQTEVSPIVGKISSKIICFFTEKGGVGKTTITLITALSKTFEGKRVLIIDADSQNNAIQTFISPTIAELMNFANINDYLRERPRRVFNVNELFKHDRKLDIVMGCHLEPELEAVLESNFNGRILDSVERFRSRVRRDLITYDLILIDMKPVYSNLNKVLLGVADDVVTLLSDDIYSMAAINSLVTFRNNNSLRFNIRLVPSRVVKAGNKIKPKSWVFLSKVVDIAREMDSASKGILYSGYVTYHNNLAGQNIVNNLKDGGCRNAVVDVLRNDVDRILHHIIRGTSEPISKHGHKFLWKKSDGLIKPQAFDGRKTCYFYVMDNRNIVKVGFTGRIITERLKEVSGKFKIPKLMVVDCFLTTMDVAKSLETIFYDNFGSPDLNETIKENRLIFMNMKDMLFEVDKVEKLLLENR